MGGIPPTDPADPAVFIAALVVFIFAAASPA